MLKTILKASVTVEQKPVSVLCTCPYCGEDIEMSFMEFCDEVADNPGDWIYSRLECTECRKEIKIDSVDWD